MATLNSSNIVNGNVVETTDILQLYDALTAGGGTTGVYNVSISGSLTGSATTSTTATTATSASNITTAITGGGTHYLTFVDQAGTRPAKLASLLEYNAATNNLQVTASRAITSSYALNASVGQVDGQRYINSLTPSTVNNGNFQFIAGGGTLISGVLTSSIYAPLAGKTMGQNVWITATYTGDLGAITSPSPTLVVNLSSSGAIIIEQLTPQNDVDIVWTGMYI
jgi:hypothetical protein